MAQAVRLAEGPVASDEDGLVLEGLRAGDERAFVHLISLYQSSMMRVARTYVSSHATAEDVVQETLLAVLEGVDRFEGRASLKTWMFRILTNRAKTAGRREHRCRPDPFQAMRELDGRSVPADRFLSTCEDVQWSGHWKHEVRSWECPADDGVLDAEAVGVICAAIRRLPTMQRLVVGLRDGENWSADEVCGLLELSESNQRVLLHRARATVRQHLESYYSDEQSPNRDSTPRSEHSSV